MLMVAAVAVVFDVVAAVASVGWDAAAVVLDASGHRKQLLFVAVCL